MVDGLIKNIEEIVPGDFVMSMDIETKTLHPERVVKLLIHENNPGGFLLVNGSLTVTPNHPMWLAEKKAWTRMEHVNIGDEFTDKDGNLVVVKSIEPVPGVYTVYNLHLEGPNNNYFAGDVLVHNQATKQ